MAWDCTGSPVSPSPRLSDGTKLFAPLPVTRSSHESKSCDDDGRDGKRRRLLPVCETVFRPIPGAVPAAICAAAAAATAPHPSASDHGSDGSVVPDIACRPASTSPRSSPTGLRRREATLAAVPELGQDGLVDLPDMFADDGIYTIPVTDSLAMDCDAGLGADKLTGIQDWGLGRPFYRRPAVHRKSRATADSGVTSNGSSGAECPSPWQSSLDPFMTHLDTGISELTIHVPSIIVSEAHDDVDDDGSVPAIAPSHPNTINVSTCAAGSPQCCTPSPIAEAASRVHAPASASASVEPACLASALFSIVERAAAAMSEEPVEHPEHPNDAALWATKPKNRRRGSVVNVARRWGCTLEDAVEMMVAFEAAQTVASRRNSYSAVSSRSASRRGSIDYSAQ